MKISSRLFKSIFSRKYIFLWVLLILSIIFQVGCGTFKLKSHWRDREIVVEGNSNDWVGAMIYFEGEKISVGILNDENFIYLCMIADDPLIRTHIMRQGLALWLDPEGGKKKTFGIKFPIGMQVSDVPMKREVPWRLERDEQNQERFREAFEESLNELEILGPGEEESVRIPVEEAKGIDIIVKASSGMLVYELKLPLNKSEEYPYAIGVKAGDSIGVGLVTPKIDIRAMRERMGRGMPGGMPGGGMRGGMGGRGPQMPKQLKVWTKVELASRRGLWLGMRLFFG